MVADGFFFSSSEGNSGWTQCLTLSAVFSGKSSQQKCGLKREGSARPENQTPPHNPSLPSPHSVSCSSPLLPRELQDYTSVALSPTVLLCLDSSGCTSPCRGLTFRMRSATRCAINRCGLAAVDEQVDRWRSAIVVVCARSHCACLFCPFLLLVGHVWIILAVVVVIVFCFPINLLPSIVWNCIVTLL